MKSIRLLKWGGGYVTIPHEDIRAVIKSHEGTVVYTFDNVYKVTASKEEIEDRLRMAS
jgi:hypothetical protein